MEEGLPHDQAGAHEALLADVERELTRVGVDFEAAATALLADRPDANVAAAADDDGWATVVGLDAAGLRAVLRTLSAGAGTAAFVAAFRAQEGWPGPATT
jgi:hypothetical protein